MLIPYFFNWYFRFTNAFPGPCTKCLYLNPRQHNELWHSLHWSPETVFDYIRSHIFMFSVGFQNIHSSFENHACHIANNSNNLYFGRRKLFETGLLYIIPVYPYRCTVASIPFFEQQERMLCGCKCRILYKAVPLHLLNKRYLMHGYMVYISNYS